jgi:hypothetical protein
MIRSDRSPGDVFKGLDAFLQGLFLTIFSSR